MRTLLVLLAVLSFAACESTPDAESRGAEVAGGGEAGLVVEDAWARPADTSGAARSAAYFTLRNGTAEPVRLVRARTDVARVAEIHQSFEESGVMRMRPAGTVEVGPGKAVVFEPGGYHVMLIDLQRPLAPGDHFPLTLSFETEGEREVEIDVREP